MAIAFVGLVIFGVILLPFVSLADLPPIVPFLVCLLFALPLQPLLVIPHELGHALVAWTLGLRVFSISLGLGSRTLYKRRVFGCTLELKGLPVVGYTFAANKTLSWFRLKRFLMILGGPAINAGLLAATIPVLFADVDPSIDKLLLWTLFWSNLLVLTTSLLPYRTAGFVASDGLQLLTLPFLSKVRIQMLYAQYFLLEGNECLQQKELASARTWFERGLQAVPYNSLLLYCLGSVLLHQGQLLEARATFVDLWGHPDIDPETRANLMNNIAWVDLCLGDRDLLEEADRYSKEAMEWLPWLPYIKGTRSSVLVELGQIEEGKALLEVAMAEQTEGMLKALNACYIAIALARRGHLPEAWIRLEEARKLDPKCVFLEKAISELRRGDAGIGQGVCAVS